MSIDKIDGRIARGGPFGVALALALGALASSLFLEGCNQILVPIAFRQVQPDWSETRLEEPYFALGQAESKTEEGCKRIHVRRLTGVLEGADGGAMVQKRRQYAVVRGDHQSGEPIISVIEVYEERDNSAYAMKLRIALFEGNRPHRAKCGGGAGKIEGEKLTWLPWWQDGGIAPSNELVRVERSLLPFLRTVTFPTSTSALVSWMKQSWIPVTKQAERAESYRDTGSRVITGKEMKEVVAAELETVLVGDLAHVQKTSAIVLLRMLNGSIQWLTIATFLAIMLMISCRRRLYVEAEHRVANDLREKFKGVENLSSNSIDPIKKSFENAWGVPSAAAAIWEGTLTSVGSQERFSSAPTFVETFAALESEQRESSAGSLRFLLGSLPGLGFIGTVVGIGSALMGTSAVLSDSLAKQQSGVSTVSLELGFAFDTTAIALVLSLIAQMSWSFLSTKEEALVSKVKRDCLAFIVAVGPEMKQAIRVPQVEAGPSEANQTTPRSFVNSLLASLVILLLVIVTYLVSHLQGWI